MPSGGNNGAGGGAPVSSTYVLQAADATLTGERVLTAGTGISLVDGGANSTLTIDSTGGPADAQYVTLATNATLTNERVLTGTANQVVLADAGAGSTITLSLPQSIATGSTVQFGLLGVGNAVSGAEILSVLGSGSIASGASAVWDSVHAEAATATITGSTGITTATGFNFLTLERPTLSAASALTVDNSATLYISNSPTGAGAGPATITNAYSIWVDAGAVRLDDQVQWGAGVAVTAANYSVGRDADGTNQLHFNVPTGATFELSVNDAAEMTLSATAVNFQNNSITTTGGGSLTGTWTDLGTVTTVDINGGTVDGAVIGGAVAAAGTFTTLTGTSVVNGLGLVATPSYTFTGDLNTGLWSPGADAVALSTGGSERLRVLSTGELCYGRTTLLAAADVVNFTKNQNGSTRVAIENTTAGTASISDLYIASDTGGSIVTLDIPSFSPTYTTSGINIAGSVGMLAGGGGLTQLTIATTTADPIVFYTNSVDRGRFLSTGSLIVGGTAVITAGDIASFYKSQNAITTVTVNNATNDSIAGAGFEGIVSSAGVIMDLVALSTSYTTSGIAVAGAVVLLAGGGSLTQMNIGTNTADPVTFWTNNVEEMRLLSGGGLMVNATAKAGTEELRVSGEILGDTSTRSLTLTQGAGSSGSPTCVLITSAAHTNQTLSTEAVGANFNFSATKEFATGALTTQREMLIQAPTYGFVGPSTLSDAITFAINGSPIAGTNATLTRRWISVLGAFEVPSFGAAAITAGVGHFNAGAVTHIWRDTTGNAEAVMYVLAADGVIVGSVTTHAFTIRTNNLPRLVISGDGTTWTINAATSITLPDACNFVLNATTGTKIGTATSQKLGFYNATPIVQGASVADATGGITVDAEARTAINALISRIEALGLIATV